MSMKSIIKKLLYESLQEQMLTDAKKELKEFELKYGDIISQHKKLKLLVDKLEHLKNIEYKIYLSKPKYSTNSQYYYVKVNYPFIDRGEKKYPHFNIQIGEKKLIDSLSDTERHNLIQKRVSSYLLDKFPL